MKLKRYHRILFVFVMGVIVGVPFLASVPVKAYHNATWVNNNVYWQSPAAGSAKSTVVGWENECTNTFNYNKANPRGRTQREVVNDSAYNQSVWITRAGDPRNINTTSVTAGQSVNMQINDMVFLCAIITMNASGYSIATDHKVTNTNYPNDRAPVPDSGAAQYKVNQASRYESNSHIYSANVVSGPASLVTSPAGQTMGYKRDNYSRYWYDNTPPKFTLKTPTNLASGRYKITLSINYATIQTYHDYGSSGTSRCTLNSTGDGANVSYGHFSVCERNTASYSFYLNVTGVGPAYDLTPQVNAQVNENGVDIGGNVAQVGDKVTFTYAVSNGGGASDGTTTCRLYANSHPGAYTIPSPVESSSNIPYTPPPTGCPRVFPANSTTTLATETITVGAGDINNNLCRSLWINPNRPVGGTALGDEVCVAVAARPYAKVFGGDTTAGNGFGAGCIQNQNAGITGWNQEAPGGYAGAGSQYAAIALAKIIDFASAQNTGGTTTPSGLAFANNAVAGSTFGGSFGSLGNCLPDYYGGKPATATNVTGPNINLSSMVTGSYTVTGDINLSGVVNPGQRIVLYVKGDAFVTSNIVYPGGWTYDNVPLLQLVVQGNIYVKNSVAQMDGTYIAQPSGGTGGGIYTCAVSATPLALDDNLYTTCNLTKLTVNGQFIADQIYLLRTTKSLSDASSGETAASSNAAEIFNYTPANWIAQPPVGSNTNTSSSGKYDAISSLPPVL